MKTYNVQVMTFENYNKMMCGDMDFTIQYEKINGENTEDAIENAKAIFKGYAILEQTVKTDEELAEIERKDEEERAKRRAEREKEEARKARAKERKIQRDLENGITPEKRRIMNNIKRKENLIKKIKEEIEEREKEVERLYKKIEEEKKKI